MCPPNANNQHSQANNAERSTPKVLLIEGEYYDITNFINRHPGGKVIEFYINQDATDAFKALHYHSPKAMKMLKSIPKVVPDARKTVPKIKEDGKSPLVQDFRKLLDEWDKRGYFNADYGILVYRILEIFAFVSLAFLIIAARETFSSPLVRIPLASLVVGVAWTRCGWLQHDGGHCGITGNTKIDHAIQALIEGFVKGGSSSWWRNRHNKHHAKCNVQGKDSDLHTYPFLSWDINTAKKLPKKYIAIQHYTFFFLLGLYVPLFFFTTKLFMYRKKRYSEALISICHYSLYVWILSQYAGAGLGEIVAFFFLGYVVQGIYLGFCFSLSHFAMPQIPEGKDDQDWVTNAVMTTLNTDPTPFLSWLTGHLNLQIEHHLCPQMPTHNLLKIKPDVEALCNKHGLKYNSLTFWEASKFTVGKLKTVANQRKLIEEICEHS